MEEFYVIQDALTKQYLVYGRDGVSFSSNLEDADRHQHTKEAIGRLKGIREYEEYDYGDKIAGKTFEIKYFITFKN